MRSETEYLWFETKKHREFVLITDRIAEIVNNYSRISFNFGPTLLSWMEANEPETYQYILKSDEESRQRFSGHGSICPRSQGAGCRSGGRVCRMSGAAP